MIEKKQYKYKLIKSKNSKRLRLTIKANQKIVVTSPKYATNKQINQFIKENTRWIESSLEKMNQSEKTKLHKFNDGETFLYLGTLYTLNITLSKDKKVCLDIKNKKINVYSDSLKSEEIKKILVLFYREETKKIIDKIYNNNFKLLENYPKINNIRIRQANTRWGSCSSKNNINFSLRLSMLPYSCMEYVFFHEITHLVVKNHGTDFYNSLEKICTNYKNLEKQMKVIQLTYNLNLS